MTFYKNVVDGYIQLVGASSGEIANQITEDEYNEILAVIQNKPARTETTDFRLKEDLTWEAYQIDPPDPDPELDEAEAFDIIFGGAG
jgi:hypothetical protein